MSSDSLKRFQLALFKFLNSAFLGLKEPPEKDMYLWSENDSLFSTGIPVIQIRLFYCKLVRNRYINDAFPVTGKATESSSSITEQGGGEFYVDILTRNLHFNGLLLRYNI